MQIYRGMRAGPDGLPTCGASARSLGVRVPKDIRPDPSGMVAPRTGGMSVAPHDPRKLPPHRRPPTLEGTGEDPVFEVDPTALGGRLSFRQDSPSHGLVEPAEIMPVDHLQGALCDTRRSWR